MSHQMEENNTPATCCNIHAYSKPSRGSESAVTDFADSMASVTPDLRNWFSSYVYQSPELTSSCCCFEDSFPVEGKPTEDTGLYVEDSEGEEEHSRTDHGGVRSNYPSIFVKRVDVDGCCLREFPDKLDQQKKVPEHSDSLQSEPPDIRNWFSSYVYESPTLNATEIGGSFPSTIDSGDTEDDSTKREKTLISTPIKASVAFQADKSIRTDAFVERKELIGCVESETDSALQENGLEDQIPRGISCCADEASDDDLAEVHIIPRLKDDSTKERIESEEGDRAGSASCHKNSVTNVGSPIKFTERVSSNEAAEPVDYAISIDFQRDPGWVVPNRKSKQGNSGRRTNQYKLLEDGLDANGKNVPRKKHRRVEGAISPEVDKGMMKTRKPFAEITNVCSSNEIAGKWRCPQKTKPSNGPPLKQLRLEKWVHRV